MLAGTRVGGRRDGGRSRTSAKAVILEAVCRFPFVVTVIAGRSGWLDAHDKRGIFVWD